MDADDLDKHLSDISTLWTIVRQAHEGSEYAKKDAHAKLLRRYERAVKRYLQKALPSGDDAEEAYQEWAIRFVSGKLRGADPARGRFRDYLKTVLYHLIVDIKTRPNPPQPAGLPHVGPVFEPPSQSDSAREFMASWRESLLERTWELLEELERKTGQPVYTVLRLRVDQPKLNSPERAKVLSAKLKKSVSAEAGRQMLRRAREKFADLLIDEVAQSLHNPTAEDLEQELQELDLLRYCQPRLRKRDKNA